MVVQLNYLKKNVFIGSGLSICVGVVFGTLFSDSRKHISSYAQIMAGSTFSVIALISLRSLLVSPPRIAAQTSTKPLQHLKLLNYQPRSISAFSSTLPSYVHSRCA